MEVANCPIPEVAEALGPFIKPRDEVAAIRRSLQFYIQKQLPGDDSILSPVNLATPKEDDLGQPPAGLTGVRKAYWKALQANQDAQAKYDALKADLENLKRPQPDDATIPEPSSITENYIPLLKQRERQRRLQVIDRAFSALTQTGKNANAPLDEQIKEQFGEQPIPPSTQPSLSRSSDVEAKVLELKKALVATKRRADEHQSRATLQASTNIELSPQAQIAGLQSALQELTLWMENQLTLIASTEEEEESGQQQHSVPPTPSAKHPPASTAGIASLYDSYITTRHRLIHSTNNAASPPDSPAVGPLFPCPSPNANTSSASQPKSPSETLLPHLPALLADKAQETALLTQNAHLRRTLSTEEDQTRRIVQRLAGESHLVPPGASRGEDWALAAREAGAAAEAFMLERLQAGEVSAKGAGEALEGMGKGGIGVR